MKSQESDLTTELHLFAGIGGGIYGGKLLDHRCIAAVEIDDFCQKVLKQRQKDGWLEPFPIYDDIKNISGSQFIGQFDVLCGGFPCQAFSTAARGRNISSKNLWDDMFRFIRESKAPMVFAENVTLKAIDKAKQDLESLNYMVTLCKLSCGDLGGDHRRDRYWLLAVKDFQVFEKILSKLDHMLHIQVGIWTKSPYPFDMDNNPNIRKQLKAVGNAQSPVVAATAFRILINRHLNHHKAIKVGNNELEQVFSLQETWIKKEFGKNFGWVHTPTTIANYSAPSMMKHQGCRNFVKVFGKPNPSNAEYLMGFPNGASANIPLDKENFNQWQDSCLT